MQSSIRYIMFYLSVHPLISNLTEILKALYDCREVDFQNNSATHNVKAMLWSVKDDAVKLKAILDFTDELWKQELMDKLEPIPTEYMEYIDRLHHHLDIANSIAGSKLRSSYLTMKHNIPNLLGQYWYIASQRSDWKNFTSGAVEAGRISDNAVNAFILDNWVIPASKMDSRNSLYANIACLLEHLFNLAKDIEQGIDWLYEGIVLRQQ